MTQAVRAASGQALARKWRPRSFDQLVGQEHVVRALTNALDRNRLHHAYLMTGTRGVGKTTLARIIAKALNCETGVSASPCGSCSACVEIDGGRFVDLIELDAASNTQVDQMRELLENALYAPTRGRFKIYIIDEVHMLSRSAFNAMLKTLEEPPEHVKFVLATTDPQKVPVTVLSRCLQFNLKQIPVPQIRSQLARILDAEGIEFEPAALQLLARAARGSMRDGLSLLDQTIAHGAGKVAEDSVRAMLGAVDQEYLTALLEALARNDGPAMIDIADEMQGRSLSFEAALQDLAGLLHRLALLQAFPETVPAEEAEGKRLRDLAGRFTAQDLQLDYQIALQGRADLWLAPDEYAGFTMTLLRMLAFAPDEGAHAREDKPAKPGVMANTGPAAKPAGVDAAKTPNAPLAEGHLDWGRLVGELKIGGMARMLAQHGELVAWDGQSLRLQVPEMHRHLLDKPYRDKLQLALEEHFGRKLKLEFAVGQPTGQTPAELEDQARQLRQQAAVQAIDRDPFVRDLVETFDARVIDESIRPIGPQTTDEGREPRGERSRP